MLSQEELLYRVALTMVPGVGPIGARRLLEQFGSAAAIFRAQPKSVQGFDDFAAAERTLAFARRYGIRIYCPGDPEYPTRLKECPDAPTVLYYKGNAGLNPPHTLSIVGTRTPSVYGRQAVRLLLRDLAPYGVLIVSGLADGIDAMAHHYALENGLSTVGVLGHGLDTIYPAGNRRLAKTMLDQGGLLTEFREGTPVEDFRFPLRNRIVAGIPEATIVVESAVSGGSLITAGLALGYDRCVLAVPGRITDTRSKGCNDMLAHEKAHCITSAADIAYQLNWETCAAAPGALPQTAEDDDEARILEVLRGRDFVHMDELRLHTPLPPSALAARLLRLELRRVIEVLPGARYRLMS